MFILLRKIRKSLIESSSFRKYTFYAIGEITLVVIGILIALQINNWSEWKKDRVKEREVIMSLSENFEMIIKSLETDTIALLRLNESSKIVLNILDYRLPYEDSLANHFHIARVPKIQLTLSQSGYEQLKNVGFDIIVNKEVKDEVVDYFESTLPNWFTNYESVNYPYVPFIDHHVPLFRYTRDKLVPNDILALYDDEYFIG